MLPLPWPSSLLSFVSCISVTVTELHLESDGSVCWSLVSSRMNKGFIAADGILVVVVGKVVRWRYLGQREGTDFP